MESSMFVHVVLPPYVDVSHLFPISLLASGKRDFEACE
jgi:hypothetical protein